MQKSSLPVSLKTLIKYHTKDGTLKFDCPIQRASGQWNNYAMSLLIHSMLSDYIIPNIYFRKEVEGGKNMLTVVDGKQRLTACMGFVNDEWTTHGDEYIDQPCYGNAVLRFGGLEGRMQHEGKPDKKRSSFEYFKDNFIESICFIEVDGYAEVPENLVMPEIGGLEYETLFRDILGDDG